MLVLTSKRLPKVLQDSSTSRSRYNLTGRTGCHSMDRLGDLRSSLLTIAIPNRRQGHTRQACTQHSSRRAISIILHRLTPLHMPINHHLLKQVSCCHRSRSHLKTLLVFTILQSQTHSTPRFPPLSTSGLLLNSSSTTPLARIGPVRLLCTRS
jgi:hypothetical protein